MTKAVLNTAFATLDCANARSNLEDAQADPRKLREALTDCFFDGSAAASEAAAQFVLGMTDSGTIACEVSDILKSLPTAIPSRNAPALAQVCAFLASSFSEPLCREPLNTFCYAESKVRQMAVKAAVSSIEETARLCAIRIGVVLDRTRAFFTELFREGHNVHDRLIAVRGLVGIGSMHPGQTREAIFSFLVDLGSDEAPMESDADYSPFEHEYESFLASELVAMGADNQCLAKIVTRCLVRALDCTVASTIIELSMTQNSKVNMAIPLIGLEVILFSLTSIAATNACCGRISACRSVLLMVITILNKAKSGSVQLNKVVCSVLKSMSLAIASMCSAAGAHDVAKAAANVCKMQDVSIQTSKAESFASVLESFQRSSHDATYWKCGHAALSLGLLQKLLVLWNQPKKLKSLFDEDFTNLIGCDGFGVADQSSSTTGARTLASEMSRDASRDGLERGSSLRTSDSQTSSLLSMMSILLAGCSHPQSQVRFAAWNALTKMRSEPSLLFFLPALITQLQDETSGVVVSFCFRNVLLSPKLLARQETGKVAMRMVLQLVRPSKGTTSTAAYHSGLVAIAGAAETAPGIATSVLLGEIEKLKGSFTSIGSPTKTAACAAILKITTLRPTRGTSFIPFVMDCTSKESMESAPEAGSICFDIIRVMAENEVLDAVKAVKVVLKTFPCVLEVAASARRTYLRLMGSVASRSSGKKGALVAGRAIELLRNSIIKFSPTKHNLQSANMTTLLSWLQVDAAALALAEYTADEILRIAHANEEPLDNPEEEKGRLERIANECMEFVHQLLSTTSNFLAVSSSTALGLQKLLGSIGKHEWENRQRSSFDPERIARLRTTSEALRRARHDARVAAEQEASAKASIAEGDRPSAQFMRSANALPTGVIKALCERCVSTKDASNDGNDDLKQFNAGAVAMRVLLQAGALSPALPWAGLAEDVLSSFWKLPAQRAASLAVLTRVDDDSFSANQSRAKWFGASCPLFNDLEKMQPGDIRELFIGMIVHQSSEVEKLFQRIQNSVTAETIGFLIEAAGEVESTATGFSSAVKGILQIIRSRELGLEEKLEKRFVDRCLKRLSADSMREFLIEAMPAAGAARFFAMIGDYTLLRACANVLVGITDDSHEDSVHSLGAALGRLPFEQRRAIIQDLCATEPKNREVKMKLAVHCLGAAALLPDVETGLRVASSICALGEREKVTALVGRLLDAELR